MNRYLIEEMKKHCMFFILLGLVVFVQPVKAQEVDTVQSLPAEIKRDSIITKENDTIEQMKCQQESEETKAGHGFKRLWSKAIDKSKTADLNHKQKAADKPKTADLNHKQKTADKPKTADLNHKQKATGKPKPVGMNHKQKTADKPKLVDMNHKQKAADMQETADLQDTIEALRLENSELKKYKAHVAPLVARQLKEMATSVEKKWSSQSYSQINAKELDEELMLYEEFKDENNELAQAYAKLNTFRGDYKLYQQGLEAIDSPYENATVRNLVDAIGKLSQREKHQGRKKELDKLLDQLRDYRITVLYFQEDIIKKVDERLDQYKREGTDSKAWIQINSYLETKDDGKVKTYMDKIPWLGKQYDEYLKQLETNPYGKNTARESIMNLVL